MRCFPVVYLCSLLLSILVIRFCLGEFCPIAHVTSCVCIGGSGDLDEPTRSSRRMKQPSHTKPSSEDSADSDHTPSEEANDCDFNVEVEEEIEEDIEEEYEEDVLVQEDSPKKVTRPAKLGVRRKSRGSSSTSGAPDVEATNDAPPGPPLHISCEPVIAPDRVMADYSKVTLDAYRKIHRTNQFVVPPNFPDPRFRNNVQADVFSSVAARQKLVDSHACIPLDFIQANPEKFPGVMDLVESVGLGPIFCFWHD